MKQKAYPVTSRSLVGLIAAVVLVGPAAASADEVAIIVHKLPLADRGRAIRAGSKGR
ncbi:hypothetical protein G8O24_33920 [Bradyrhizobium sp. INPA01-394B]|uniref:Uncharacterized protein n=1 Tax=Bradyrhizobium campsiandrae TaxID=1729892 RepID=A0ABR7UI99_9BRAD|nr:hypothetical protein [Bradyrhizobium campsiandrae]MBC9882311.1 hypothetical protein [Bradyrhizobium campsiandrae]MBC9983204.1 hypothetical protein [Bradyrhizobium campsiandrae]